MKNPKTERLVMELKKQASINKVSLWKRVSQELEKPTRLKRVINLQKIDKNSKDNDIIVVPGKVLAGGDLKNKVTIAAFEFSKTAIEKINSSGSKAVFLEQFVKENPKVKNAKLLG